MIKTETYEWIDRQLEDARDDGVILLPVAHHNLLEESKVYVDDCTIEHSEELIQKLEGENIPLFLSGHLHVQHYMQNNDIGIYEIVTSSMSTRPVSTGCWNTWRMNHFPTIQTRSILRSGPGSTGVRMRIC